MWDKRWNVLKGDLKLWRIPFLRKFQSHITEGGQIQSALILLTGNQRSSLTSIINDIIFFFIITIILSKGFDMATNNISL